jgi:hypothetical protein
MLWYFSCWISIEYSVLQLLKEKFITFDKLHWCWINTKKPPYYLAWNISKSWWRPFLSHVMVFFMFIQCRIPYFTIIIRENSLHLTGCIGVEEIPKNVQTSSLKDFQIVVETFSITCNGIFLVESVRNTLFYNY